MGWWVLKRCFNRAQGDPGLGDPGVLYSDHGNHVVCVPVWLGIMLPVLGVKSLSSYALAYLQRLLMYVRPSVRPSVCLCVSPLLEEAVGLII